MVTTPPYRSNRPASRINAALYFGGVGRRVNVSLYRYSSTPPFPSAFALPNFGVCPVLGPPVVSFL